MLTPGLEIAGGMWAVVKRDMLRAASYKFALVGAVVSEFLGILLFFYLAKLVRAEPFSEPEEYFAFVVVGLIGLQLANSVLFLPLALIQQELTQGSFERLVVSPLGPLAGIVAVLAFPFLASVATSVAVVAFAALALGLPVVLPDALLALPCAALIGAAFMPFGLLLISAALIIKQAVSLAGFVVTGLALLAGLYFPVALLPGWLEWAADVQPLTPAVDLMRSLVVDTPTSADPLELAARLAAFGVVLVPASIWTLSGAINLTRRRGTIVEY